MSRKSLVYKLDEDEFRQLIKASVGYSDALRKLGLSTRGGSTLDVLKRRINELRIDTSHFSKGACISKQITIYPLNTILVKHSKYANMSALKRRLIKEKLLIYRCDICGLSSWQDKPIALQIDHINGDNSDNRINNLRLLCPNCHSQTNTYAGKNKYKNL